MLNDVEIAAQTTVAPIAQVAAHLGLSAEDVLPYGHDKAKVRLSVLDSPRQRPNPPRLVLVTAISPTPAGEGKTTTSIGLGQGLAALGESVCVALREPSLGPCMGVKGGATGGGYAQVTPAASINLHFTGDFHAITSAHNLLAAAIDNHLHHGNALTFNPKRVVWPRVIDMNDRSLREVVVGIGAKNGALRETGFDITAASEIMAVLCLSTSLDDLRERLGRMIVGYNVQHRPIRADALGVTGAMVALLKDALLPNLVQTLEGTPVLMHGGPFANIAHGCNSVLATRMSMHLADWTVTEAGFGCDLGAEKFLNIKCVEADLDPSVVVIVATVRALKMHGGKAKDQLGDTDLDALSEGLCNLEKHIETVQAFGKQPVVAMNRFHSDSEQELELIAARCRELGVSVALAEHYARGGQGAMELAQMVMTAANSPGNEQRFRPMYEREQPIPEKIEAVARNCYGAVGVEVEPAALRDMARIKRQGFAHLPICIAKTQNSLSDNPKLLGRPEGFTIGVRRVLLNAGAGFLVVLTGNIMRMPGLPKAPAAQEMDVVDDRIVGIT